MAQSDVLLVCYDIAIKTFIDYYDIVKMNQEQKRILIRAD